MSRTTKSAGAATVALGEVIKRIVDKRSDPYADGLTRFVGVEDLDSNDLTLRRWGQVDNGDLPPTFRYAFPKGSVLFPTRRPALRKCAVAPFDGITGEKILVLRSSDEERLSPMYAHFLLSSPALRQWVIDRAIGSVTPHFRWRDLADFEFALPPLAEQMRITEILSSAQRLVESTLVSFEKALLVRRAAQESLLIERGNLTETCELQELAEFNPSDPPLQANHPFVPMEMVKAWDRQIVGFEQKGDRGGVRARAGDVLMARITPCLQNGKIAQVPIGSSRCGGSTEFIVIRPRAGVDPSYLYWVITSARVRRIAVGRMAGTTGRQRAAASDLIDIRVPMMASRTQVTLGKIIDEMEASRMSLRQRLNAARHFAAFLTQELLQPISK